MTASQGNGYLGWDMRRMSRGATSPKSTLS